MDKRTDKYLVALGKFRKLGPKRFQQLFSYFNNSEDIWRGETKQFMEAGLDEKIAKELKSHIEKTSPEKESEILTRHGIKVISIFDNDYPERLSQIYNPPFILYIKGSINSEEECFAIVGSRKPTDYGRHITEKLVEELAFSGTTIVSGLALGVDTIAHKVAVNAGTRTIAVLGCGLDQIYPASNVNLVKEIIKNGAVISEYPLGTPPLRPHFPARNRIISGLSKGVLLTEASEGSGSLITAKEAIEQNRDVFAVPGNIFNKNSVGPNNLIKMGAKPVTSGEDILTELNLSYIPEKHEAKKTYPKTKEEEQIVSSLELEPKHIDEIIKETKIEAQTASSTLTMMELKGLVKNLGGMVYTLIR